MENEESLEDSAVHPVVEITSLVQDGDNTETVSKVIVSWGSDEDAETACKVVVSLGSGEDAETACEAVVSLGSGEDTETACEAVVSLGRGEDTETVCEAVVSMRSGEDTETACEVVVSLGSSEDREPACEAVVSLGSGEDAETAWEVVVSIEKAEAVTVTELSATERLLNTASLSRFCETDISRAAMAEVTRAQEGSATEVTPWSDEKAATPPASNSASMPLLMLEMADGEAGSLSISSASGGMADFPGAHGTFLDGSSSLCFFLLLASSQVGVSDVGTAGVGGSRGEALEWGVEGVGEAPNGMTSLPV